jgi:hypothetical protein
VKIVLYVEGANSFRSYGYFKIFEKFNAKDKHHNFEWIRFSERGINKGNGRGIKREGDLKSRQRKRVMLRAQYKFRNFDMDPC